MATATLPETRLPTNWTLADLQRHLGDIPFDRIRLYPPPGLATVEDVNRIRNREGRSCELIDGVLVEKPMGWNESFLAAFIITKLNQHILENSLGRVLGEAGTLQIFPDMVKIPDVCFIGWQRMPASGPPPEPIPLLVPDLVVEVLSESNTKREMDKKMKVYLDAGVSLVWYIDPQTRSARAYTAVDEMKEFDENGILDAGKVVPGFQLSLGELFAELDRKPPTAG